MVGQKGITLVSLIITIVLLLIIAGTTVYTSVNRFKINNVKKMYNDIELLDDKVNNYYLKYGGLPVIKDADNNPLSYTHTAIDFNKDVNDNNNYYIIDLSAIGNITLNYGKEGHENPNNSDDVYIINEKSHTVYYVRGIEYTDGNLYHSKKVDGDIKEDTVPPTTPEIKVVEGDEIIENNYETNVTLEFVAGKDNYSGVNKTTYSINRNTEQNIDTLENHQYKINETGIYDITIKTYDNNNNVSETTRTIYIGQVKQVEYLESTGTQYIDTGINAKSNLKIDITLANMNTSKSTHFIGGRISFRNSGIGISKQYDASVKTLRAAYSNDIYDILDSTNQVESTSVNNYVLNNNFFYVNGTLVNTFESTEFNSNLKVYIFTSNDGGTAHEQMASIRVYHCEIYDNGNLAREYIPVIDQNGVACLYDKVEGKYYYNQGTGDFKTNLDE